MKTVFAAVAVLCLISVVCCQDPCETTAADQACILMKFSDMGQDNGTFNATCGQVDFPAVATGNLTTLCPFPDCITLLGTLLYEPCNRPELTDCTRESCGIMGPTGATDMEGATEDATEATTEGAERMFAIPSLVLLVALLSTLH